MNLYKKIIGFALLLLVAAPIFIFTTYSIKQKIVQAKMQEALEQKALQTIVLNEDAVVWEEEGNEIIIDGKLFDVKSYYFSNDKITVVGLYDTQETALVNVVEKLQQQKNKSKTPLDNLVLKFMFTAIMLPAVNEIKIINSFCQNNFHTYNDAIYLQYCFVESPPPIL